MATDCSNGGGDGAGNGFQSSFSSMLRDLQPPDGSHSSGGAIQHFTLFGQDLPPLSSEQSSDQMQKVEPEEGAEAAAKIAPVKEEAFSGEAVGGSSSLSSSSSPVGLANPLKELQEYLNPPAFLNKTFQMVDDPSTNPIISWSHSGKSFVVWDSHEFSKTLLPQYFKHSNFSSFIRQLNTYCFRKIDWDRWEFFNDFFQEGKRHLLRNIKRKIKPINNTNSKHQIEASDSAKLRLQAEVEILKKDKNTMRSDMLKLIKQLEDSQIQIAAVEERIKHVECRQKQILIFLSKAGNAEFVELLMRKRKQMTELEGGESGKKRRVLVDSFNGEECDDCGKQVDKELMPTFADMNETSCSKWVDEDLVAKDDSNRDFDSSFSKIYLGLEECMSPLP